jgi:8-oxo-dGTP pyrophosphatase MutT (NUDIX family)
VHVQAFLVDVEPVWEPQLNDEHDEYRWLRREEAAELLYWPEPADLLRSLPR